MEGERSGEGRGDLKDLSRAAVIIAVGHRSSGSLLRTREGFILREKRPFYTGVCDALCYYCCAYGRTCTRRDGWRGEGRVCESAPHLLVVGWGGAGRQAGSHAVPQPTERGGGSPNKRRRGEEGKGGARAEQTSRDRKRMLRNKKTKKASEEQQLRNHEQKMKVRLSILLLKSSRDEIATVAIAWFHGCRNPKALFEALFEARRGKKRRGEGGKRGVLRKMTEGEERKRKNKKEKKSEKNNQGEGGRDASSLSFSGQRILSGGRITQRA